MEVFVVARVIRHISDDEAVWNFVGVFDSLEEAEKHCFDETYFLGSTHINKAFKEGMWEMGYYPRAIK